MIDYKLIKDEIHYCVNKLLILLSFLVFGLVLDQISHESRAKANIIIIIIKLAHLVQKEHQQTSRKYQDERDLAKRFMQFFNILD